MQRLGVVARPNLSNELAAALRDRVLSGALAPGSRINEVHLAKALGVSRTPLREALSLCAAEGFIENVPRRGSFVRGLSSEEMEHLYVVRTLLDPEALRLAGIPPHAQLAELAQLNRTMASTSSKNPARLVALDDAWHRLLLSHCPNPILLQMIEQHMLRTRRYEHAYMREQGNAAAAVDEHQRILAALLRGDLAQACDALRLNMVSAREPLLAWLRQREADAAAADQP